MPGRAALGSAWHHSHRRLAGAFVKCVNRRKGFGQHANKELRVCPFFEISRYPVVTSHCTLEFPFKLPLIYPSFFFRQISKIPCHLELLRGFRQISRIPCPLELLRATLPQAHLPEGPYHWLRNRGRASLPCIKRGYSKGSIHGPSAQLLVSAHRVI